MSKDLMPGFSHPFHGTTNTSFQCDYGDMPSRVRENAKGNASFMGVQSKPKAFQPFFRFGESIDGGTNGANKRSVVGGRGAGQPTSLAYNMESQNIKLVK